MFKYLAQSAVGGGVDPAGSVSNIDSAGVLLIFDRIIAFVFTSLIIFSVIAVIYSAFKYATAGANAEEVRTANRALVYAVLAVLTAYLSKGITTLIIELITGGGFAG